MQEKDAIVASAKASSPEPLEGRREWRYVELVPKHPNQILTMDSTRSILTVIGAVCSLFNSIGFANAFGIFQEYYRRNQLAGRSDSAISWIGSIMMFIMFMSAAPAGLLLDRIGPTPLLAAGHSALLLSVFMTSLCQKYYQFILAQAILMGFGAGFATIPATASVTKHFKKHRGIATGFTIAGSSLGGIIWPIMLNRLLNYDGMSFGWSVRVVGFTMIPLAILSTSLVRAPEKPVEEKTMETEANHSVENQTKKKSDLSVLRKPAFIFTVIGVSIFNLAMFVPFFYVTVWSTSLGHSAAFSFYLVSALNGASLFGRVGFGAIADKFGAYNLLTITSIISAIICFSWTTATSIGGLIAWSLAYGFLCGACLSLELQAVTTLATPETHGTVMGLGFGSMSITGLVGTPIAGALVPHGWIALSMYSGASLMTGAVFIVLSRLSLSRELKARV